MEYFLNLSSFKVIDKKTELQLDTVISPSDATFENAEWKSSNDKIVTFDDGEMFIVGTGKVVLTAEAHYDYGYLGNHNNYSFGKEKLE